MNSLKIDLLGKRFGDWTVIGELPVRYYPSGVGVTRWRCRCVCGNEADVSGQHLRTGVSRGCAACRGRHVAETRGTLLPAGETRRQASERLGGSTELVAMRLARGWPPERAASVPPGMNSAITVGGVTRRVSDWLALIGISRQAFHQRVARGMTRESAATAPKMTARREDAA